MRLLIAAIIAVLFVGEAAAQSCNSARKQLAAAQSGVGNVSRLEAQFKANRCDLPGRFGRPRACAGIEAKLRRARGGGQIAALQRRVDRACSERQVVRRAPEKQQSSTVMIGGRVVSGVHTPGKRNKNIFSSIFGGIRPDSEETAVASYEPSRGVERVDLGEAQPKRSSGQSSGSDAYAPSATRSSSHVKGDLRVGNSRTVCVRLCDGFYFPINNRSHSENFYDELAMCVGRCPGADVSLYSHSNSSPVESMRSTMTGERYVNLPTAFAYRKRVVPGCGCQPQTTGTPDKKVVETVVASLKDDAETATDMAATEPAASTWSPYEAIYDETGEALPALKTDRTSEPPVRPTGLTLPNAPRKADAANTVAMDTANHFRTVGPQFFSKMWAEPRTAPVRPKTSGVATSAVTVIPLGTTAPRQSTPVEAPTVTMPPAATPAMVETQPSGQPFKMSPDDTAGADQQEARGPVVHSQGG